MRIIKIAKLCSYNTRGLVGGENTRLVGGMQRGFIAGKSRWLLKGGREIISISYSCHTLINLWLLIIILLYLVQPHCDWKPIMFLTSSEGNLLGSSEGDLDGSSDGRTEGSSEGVLDGSKVGVDL